MEEKDLLKNAKEGDKNALTILINENTRLIVQGITGKEGSYHASLMKKYGTKVVAGVTPGKGGQEIEGIPVFNSVYEAMKNTKFGGRIVHGMLLAGLVSAVLGMQLPGPGTIYLSQQLSFKAAVKMGDTVKAVVEIVEKLEKGRVRIKTNCYNQDGVEVLDGEALVIAPRE